MVLCWYMLVPLAPLPYLQVDHDKVVSELRDLLGFRKFRFQGWQEEEEQQQQHIVSVCLELSRVVSLIEYS